jgi:hypothetical protein
MLGPVFPAHAIQIQHFQPHLTFADKSIKMRGEFMSRETVSNKKENVVRDANPAASQHTQLKSSAKPCCVFQIASIRGHDAKQSGNYCRFFTQNAGRRAQQTATRNSANAFWLST